jgi:hypothetical protein
MAYNNRGVAWRDKGASQRALADFKAAVELDPDLSIAVEHQKKIEQDISSMVRPQKPSVSAAASAASK